MASQVAESATATSDAISSTHIVFESETDASNTKTSFSDEPTAIASLSVTATADVIAMATETTLSAHVPALGCPEKTGDEGLFAQANRYVQEIMNSSTNSSVGDMPRLKCPIINVERYSHLAVGAIAPGKPRYFFAMNLFQSVAIMPQLLASTVEVMRFLGPELCALSIVEGRSTDGTFEILQKLAAEMESLGVQYSLSCNERNPWGGETDRISALAELRNQALAPLTHHPGRYDISTTIIFLNDVAPCADDILELVHQRSVLEADMTCAMDWINDGVAFYDAWIARQLNGELFFEVPQSGSWEFSKNLFWNHQESRTRYKDGKAVQVFSCWNGAVALNAQPFMEGKIDFRSAREGECYFGEPTLLAKDLWKLGNGRIAIIPKVNLGYSVEVSAKAKKLHGWVSKPAGKKGDIPCFKLFESDKVLAFLDIQPLSKGHALVIPKHHGVKITDIPDDALTELLPVVKKIAAVSGAENYNILQNNGRLAHQEVDHVHFHMIPKPNQTEGLGIGWPATPTDMDALKKLHADLKAKM
ncbi:hypothetical protein LTR10_021311 [Elasticomyces elasticus]|nr:hypothetical protein LTR10_021311 [Elasticomyces elasticus]KAK5029151.1 hypothetical protein LTR13_008688 [Exophiala sideris]